MAFHYSKRKLRPAEDEDGGELNIIPYLDILMNLIIFMLLSMTGLATFGILNVNAPNYGGGSAGAGDTPDEKPLLLTVAIAKAGFYVGATGGVLPGQTEGQAAVPGQGEPTIARKGADYDYLALTELMKKVKIDYPKETKVIIAAEADTSYEALVATMDATRETPDRKLLFPDVTLGAF